MGITSQARKIVASSRARHSKGFLHVPFITSELANLTPIVTLTWSEHHRLKDPLPYILPCADSLVATKPNRNGIEQFCVSSRAIPHTEMKTNGKLENHTAFTRR